MADITQVSPAPRERSRGAGLGTGRRRPLNRRAAKAWLYLLPAVIFYASFAIWPALNTFYLSFLNWDGVQPPSWAGLGNYVQIVQDPALYNSVLNALLLIVFFSFIPVCMGLLMTALLMGRMRRGMAFFRTVLFLPQVLPLVAVGVTWRWLYNETGLFNQFLELIGLGGITRAWLGDYDLALIALGFIGTWTMSGLCMLLFLSGAQKIDPALYEAATLDGAGAFRQFRSVTVPGVRREITIAGVITTIAALASFDLVFVTTNGGPADQTTVPALLVYRLAFNEGDIGTASALAITLTALVIGFVTLIRRLARENA
ncbi:carbohydrate ABC transporter permease [Phytoactinopolyspora mesophila]|uniref:ABC transporter permease subunit n=1 Tax=Phytoactinopolyspora mesophila TaxID=2650750 RepID=A0A7K3LYT3_9ACTN|nr:sugar ABC transporter permease [Phytoactinopolyspora mesophila]NDL56193.1 ABC transporter permease subunit [Phytoactinopolyspora mesophila]